MRTLNRSFALLVVAVLAGLCAAWTARMYLDSRVRQLEDRANVPMVGRVVAAYDLPAGTQLNADHVAVRQYPAANVSSASIDPQRFTEIDSGVLRVSLQAGDPILPVHIRQENPAPFSSKIGQGRRAITIPVDVINSVSGLLEPGDLIDLYVSFEYRRKKITAPLLQGVLVLATGSQTRPDYEGTDSRSARYTTVTLDTSPEDAIKLVAARHSGMLTALLRHPADIGADQKAVRGDLASLLGVKPAARPRNQPKVPVIYGNRPIRRVPGLKPKTPQRRPASGVFDLPYMPELVSAWLRRQAGGVEQPYISDYADMEQ